MSQLFLINDETILKLYLFINWDKKEKYFTVVQVGKPLSIFNEALMWYCLSLQVYI